MENLDWLEWQTVTTPLSFRVIQRGAFPEKITEIDLSRDADLRLTAVGKGMGSFSLEEHINLRPGEAPSYAEETIGQTMTGVLVRLRGVLITSTSNKSKSLQVEETDPLFIHAKVNEAEIFQSELPAVAQVEWIVNFSADRYIFSRCTTREHSASFKRERSGGGVLELDLNKNFDSSLDHFKCECTMSDQKWSLTVGHTMDDIAPQKYKPGFVEFEDLNENRLPSEDTKQTILAALSFTLGRQLVSVGSTSLSKDGGRIGCVVREIYILGERAYKYPCKPPVSLGISTEEWYLDEKRISRMISSVATKMETINIEYPLFLIWLGLTSPLDVQAVHFGAAIESLRDSYCANENELSPLLIPKSVWKTKIRKPLMDTFDEVTSSLDKESIESKNLDILKRKLEDLNKKSSNMQYEKFFDLLSLQVGRVELQALKERNKSAHGHRYKPLDCHRLSMTSGALYSLFNRLLLKITEANDHYIDYSTYGYPIRDIDCPLGGPEGDGKPAFS
ncbi:hypothetical protein H6G00_01135 [Leptolyngbya sp. FACHB-541]|uniref:hypothetical protein n=1 Tax=Leptolyngbya sp. FACHB-541 TaxID=2692810 RepID=UPI0016847437|nr:hypothetical protein [Leptolyngbya sp. FACHB-541]MBD1995233.1 hypothetical protein [Leptolyngbya sp. FACHB-541]